MTTYDGTQKQQMGRDWLQAGGAVPTNPVTYGGKSGDWFFLKDTSIQIRGGVTKTVMASPDRRGGYITTFASSDPVTDFPGTSMEVMRQFGRLSGFLYRPEQYFTAYSILGSNCGSPSEPNTWDGVIKVSPELLITTIDQNQRSAQGDTNDDIMDTVNLTITRDTYEVGKIEMSQRASAATTLPMVATTFGGTVQDASCGSPNAGDAWVYHLMASDVAAAPVVVYDVETVNGRVTGTSAITGSVAEEVAKDIACRGNTLVVLTATGYYVSELGIDGVPGAFTKVTTGFTLPANAPNAMSFAQQGLVIVGNGGYVYLAVDLLGGVTVRNAGDATTANLTEVAAQGTKVLAGGVGGVLVDSQDGGLNYTLIVSPVGADVTALEITQTGVYLVGASGNIYDSITRGQLWHTGSFSGAGTGVVESIVAATPEMLFLSHTTVGGVGRLFSSTWGGATPRGSDTTAWAIHSNTAHKRVLNIPAAIGAIRDLAVPRVSNQTVAANNLSAVGADAAGTAGLVYTGRASVI